MRSSFIRSVLSTQKQRQRFFYFRNFSAGACALMAGVEIGGGMGLAVGFVVLFLAYYTVAPIIAFIICLIEQMAS
jgi:hypothetical protein